MFPSANDSRVSVAVDARQHVRVRLAGTGAEAKAETGAVAVDAEDGWSSENERSLARVMERCLATYSERLIAAVRGVSLDRCTEAEAAKTLGASAAGLG